MPRNVRIAHAFINLEDFGGRDGAGETFFRSALADAWRPGAQVTRYSRTWKLSARREYSDVLWGGHIGSVKEGSLTTLDWDDEAQDFVRGEAPSGVVVPFVVHVQKAIVSFQLVSGEARVTTVTGNLQALLNETGTATFSLIPIWVRRRFDDWRGEMQSIRSYSVNLEQPNPRYSSDRVEELIEGLDAARVQLRARAEEDDSLEVDHPWFVETMDHVRRGYGHATVVGVSAATDEPSTFIETPEGGAESVVDKVELDEEAIEASPEDLAGSMSRLPDNIVGGEPDDEDPDPEGS